MLFTTGSGRRLAHQHHYFPNTISLSPPYPASFGVRCYSVDGRPCGLITNTHISKSTTFLLHHKAVALDGPVASSNLIWTHCYDEWIVRNQALDGHNDQTRELARLYHAQYLIDAMYEFRNKCSRYVRDKWFYSSPEEHFLACPDPFHLKNRLAVKESSNPSPYHLSPEAKTCRQA
jgi:hypothetical protein